MALLKTGYGMEGNGGGMLKIAGKSRFLTYVLGFLLFFVARHAEPAKRLLKLRWNFGIIGLVASRSISVRCKWEIPDYKEDKSHNSAAKLWHVRNASLKKLSI